MSNSRSKVLMSNIVFVIVSMLFITFGSFVQSWNAKVGILVTEYIILLVPMFIYLIASKANIKKSLKLNGLSLKQIILIATIVIMFLPVALFANSLMIFIMKSVGLNIAIPPVPSANNSTEYISLLFIIAFTAGVCEELFFRGFIMSSYRDLGKRKSIIGAAILFALLHFNLANFLSPLLLGCVFGYMVYITNSLFASILAHMLHNGIIVSYLFLMSTKYSHMLEQVKNTNPGDTIGIQHVIAMFIMAMIFGSIAFVLLKLLKKVSVKRSPSVGAEISSVNYSRNVVNYLPLLLPLIAFIYFNIRW